nr:TraX family protein [Escherichia coli]
VRALSRDIMKQNRVTVHPEKSVPRTAGYSDAVSVLAQDRPSLAIVSGQGGAAGQRERVAELVMMAREQGREVQIIAADRRSQMNLKQDERLAGLVMTVLTVGLVSCTGKSLPRFWYGDFFPTFYACHLTVLGVLAV